MKIAAIVICWHDWDLMDYCVENIRRLVDEVIIIGSIRSNYGEVSPVPKHWLDAGMANNKVNIWLREPHFNLPLHSETDKRNYGISIARERGNTHFISMDADELYKPEEFLKVKEKFDNPDLQGIVCPVVVYFKSPTLCLGRDITLVPHIHKLTKTIQHEFNRSYPFAWERGQIRIDPSRSLNINTGVEYTEEIELHHYSWVRKDYNLKIRNSTARKNLERSTILKDLMQAKEGHYVEFYRKRLTRCPNLFGIPEYECNPEDSTVLHKDL